MTEVRLNQKQAKDLRNKVLSAANELCRSSLNFAEMLYTIKFGVVTIGRGERGLVHAWGYDNFEQYVEKELGYHFGTANAYVRVHHSFFVFCKDVWNPSDLPKSITKFRALSKVVKPSNCTAWLQKANELTCCELEEAVEHELYGTGRPGGIKTFTATVRTADCKKINRILDQACAEFGTAKRGDALAKALDQWGKALAAKPKLRAVG